MSAAQTRGWAKPMGGTWKDLIKAKQQAARYRIILNVRGREITKDCRNRDDYRKWREAFEIQKERGNSGIEDIRCEIVYG